ncbi:MAG TPA: DUF411 domain-containing protein [Limnobacter sp.]|nr:DUF411 domain-containing protein [Limnobacter sp.]
MSYFIKSSRVSMVAGVLVTLLLACSESGNKPDVTSNGQSVNAGPAPATEQLAQFVEVWKTPTCGCCAEWVKHLENNGFVVKVHDVNNTDSFRAALGMPQKYGSCHSARVGGYAIEGHVPAEDIKKLLSEKPVDVTGLSVPAMPMGSPGMEHPDFPHKRAEYEVLLVNKSGGHSTFTRYDAVN